MRATQQVVRKALSSESIRQAPSGWQSVKQREEATLWIWQKLSQRYGHQWVSSYGETPNDEWLRSIEQLGAEAVKRGFFRVVNSDKFTNWPPTLPQFEQACKLSPEDVGCPPLDAAWRNAQVSSYPYARAKWTHKAVWWAACKSGLSDIAENARHAAKSFSAAYAEAITMLDEIPDPPKAVIENKKEITEADRQAGHKALEQMKTLLGMA